MFLTCAMHLATISVAHAQTTSAFLPWPRGWAPLRWPATLRHRTPPATVPLADLLGIAYDTTMKRKIVIDTNVLVAALRSKRGASSLLLRLVGSGKFEINVSVPIVFEYEEVDKRTALEVGIPVETVDALVDYLCTVAVHREIHFLWRPYLRDMDDDFVLELAVESQCDAIVTYNKRDFEGIDRFGLRAITPKEFLEEIGELP